MTDNAVPGRGHTRHRDRRTGVATLVTSLIPALHRAEGALLRRAFEETTRRLVFADRVVLRDGPRDAGVQRGLAQIVSLEVPSSDRTRSTYLDATSVAGRRFDEWDVQVLGLASQLAAFVLEVERLRAPRSSTVVPNGAAPPVVGSTSVMRALRQRIAELEAKK